MKADIRTDVKMVLKMDSKMPTWYEQRMALDELIMRTIDIEKGHMPAPLAGLVLTLDAMIESYRAEMHRVYKNIDRDIDVTNALLDGARLKEVAHEYNVSTSRVRDIMGKVFQLSLNLTEGRYPMPEHDHWKLCEVRWEKDYWRARVKQFALMAQYEDIES